MMSEDAKSPGPRTRNIIENQLFRRQRSLKLEALQRQRTLQGDDDTDVDEPFDKTQIVIIFTEKAKLRHCQDVEKIIKEFGIQTTLETVGKTEKYLYLSASLDTLLRLADVAELEKKTTTGSMQKFNNGCISDFLLPGMGKDQILRYCEIPVLIKDVIKPAIKSYILKGYIEDMFPLHDILYLDRFNWNLKRSHLPIEDIRNYFGSSIGLYFGFIEFYTKALIFPAVFGILQYLFDLNLSIVCSFYVVWTTIFLELWKRKCAGYSYRWGTIEMSSLDKPRSAYQGQLKPDPITGKMTLHYPMRYTYLQMYCISYPVVLVCVVAAGWFALYQFQIEAEVLADFGADSWLLYVPVIVQSILIAIFSWAYEKLATFLTKLENHRTRSQYDRHRVNKLMLFEIVNNFFSQFYIAFVLQDLKQLKYQLMMQLLIFQLLCIAQEIGIPLMAVLRQKYAKFRHRDTVTEEEKLDNISDQPRYEQSFYESGLDAYHSTYEDYLQVCIQFGFVVLFAAVAPFAAIGALINNVFAVHIDMFKLCNIFKRPFARRAKNIGAWQLAFELLSVMSLLSNCGLLFLQPNVKEFFSHWLPTVPELSFVIFEHLLLGLKFVIHKVIHERPRWVRIGLLKADFETSQALKQLKKFKAETNKMS
ncbi:anoctamin-10 [Drosophila pseudoobscura]|uniref:Anoctamin n=1 Tax=Drosophila pseudoobscura pseudoobscura TaxID=46245 RepID=A0A6I8UG53_DROPS|nr:anoctamin-10 [Drosophila pseudoobscura]